MSINVKDVEHIANLARINLEDDNKLRLAKDLTDILGYVDKLNEIDTKQVEPTAQVTGLENVFRQDEIEKNLPDFEAGLLVGQAPDREGNYVKVKAVFDRKK